MGELSIPEAGDSGELLAPFMDQARQKLEGEPDRKMIARIAKDPARGEGDRALLRPVDRRFSRRLVGRDPLEQRPIGLPVATVAIGVPLGVGARLGYNVGLLSEIHFAITVLALSAFVIVAGIGIGISSFRYEGKQPDAFWTLPSGRSPVRPAALRGRDVLDGGEEARLGRHSAAALWELHAGDTSRVWRSSTLADWRSRVDLRAEATETIRAAGALQELREALGDFPVYVDDEAKVKWKADYAVYRAGLSSLRDRVEQQVALQLAVEAIGRQLDTPLGARAELADRITAALPSNEQSVENLAEINTQSADLLALLNLQTPTIEAPDSRSSTLDVGFSARQREVEGAGRDAE